MINVILHFPDNDSILDVLLPALPRVGESFEWDADDDRQRYWRVTAVEFLARPREEGIVGVYLSAVQPSRPARAALDEDAAAIAHLATLLTTDQRAALRGFLEASIPGA